MASGTRGKLKEELEGVHRNCEWIKQHCTKCLSLLGENYPTLIENFQGLAKVADELDKFTQALYAHI